MTLRIAFLAVLFSLSFIGVSAQEKIVIPLRLNTEVQQFMGMQIAVRTDDGRPLRYSWPASEGLGHAPATVLFKLDPVPDSPNTYQLFIDANGDGDIRNESPQTLSPNSSLMVKIRRSAGQNQPALPYVVKYSRSADSTGRMREQFTWSPQYRAEGRFKMGTCDALFTVLDLSTDGQFDDRDLGGGSSVGLDRNGDGKISGKDEYLMGHQIVEFCGDRFLVDALASDGTSITLVKTTLRVPKIGEQISEFSLTTLDGQTIASGKLRNKIYLLDFWASWCKPCVEKFGLVKKVAEEFKADVSVIAINVDESALLPNAHEIIKEYGLTWPHVMNGKGEADPLWKTFGGMEGNRLAIPLYVIVDPEGRLRYAANGGEDLSELRTVIKSLLK